VVGRLYLPESYIVEHNLKEHCGSRQRRRLPPNHTLTSHTLTRTIALRRRVGTALRHGAE
jgi:hypothetical protein